MKNILSFLVIILFGINLNALGNRTVFLNIWKNASIKFIGNFFSECLKSKPLLVLFFTLSIIFLYGQGCSPGDVWVIDEDSANPPTHLHLWSFKDYNSPSTSAIDYGLIRWVNSSNNTVTVGEAKDIESMAMNMNTNELYFTSAEDVIGGPGGQALWYYDVDNAPANVGNIIVTLLGHLNIPGGSENMSYDPNTNRLYFVKNVGSALNSNTNPDILSYVDLSALNANPMQLTNVVDVGVIQGLGATVGYGDGMDFNEDYTKLYVVDGNDLELYEVNPATAAITAIADNNIPGGLGVSADVETVMWDPTVDKLIGIDNKNHQFVEITLGSNGNNIVLGTFLPGTPGLPGGSDPADFEGSAMGLKCPPTVCSITNITATPGTCNPANNQYSVTGNITFTNPPATGTLTVSVGATQQVFNAPFTSPQAYTLSGLTADGASHTVTAVFSADANCTSTTTYNAPIDCTPNSCTSTLTAIPGVCNSSTNQYTLTGAITFANPPTSGTMTVSVSGGGSQVFNAPFTSPQNYSISGLTSDGASHTVTATFSADGTCTSNTTYTAPASCGCNNTPLPLCPGESYTLTAQAGYQNYQWYTVSGTTETPIAGAMSQTYVVTATGIYKWKAQDGNACPVEACCKYEFVPLNCIVCSISNLGIIVGNCDNKGTLTNANDDEYTFTLNPTGTDLGTTYTVSGLPNSPITGTYGSPTTFGPYLISGGVLSITVTDNTTSGCTATATVTPPPSCSVCDAAPPVLTVNDNICPSRTGSINLIQDCGTGSTIQYSTNNGMSWTTVKPLYSTSSITILSRCVNSSDTACKSTNSTVTTNPKKCPGGGTECSVIANATVDPCNNNGTDNDATDDYFTIQINASVSNGGSTNKYEVVVGADPLTGIGGNVLNSGGTNYGSPITVGNTKIFKADGLTSYQLVVRDINNNNCFQIINLDPVASCSIAPPKSPCYPVPCVPIGTIKN